METIKKFSKKKNTCVMALKMIYDNNGGNAKKVYRVLSCVVYSLIEYYFCIDYLSCQPKALKLYFIQTNISRYKYQYFTRYWNCRTVTEPSILSWFHEGTKFNCDIKLPV